MKKKKRMDPAILKAREDRSKRRLMREIRKLKKNEGQLKPVHETSIPLSLITEKE